MHEKKILIEFLGKTENSINKSCKSFLILKITGKVKGNIC